MWMDVDVNVWACGRGWMRMNVKMYQIEGVNVGGALSDLHSRGTQNIIIKGYNLSISTPSPPHTITVKDEGLERGCMTYV